MPLTLPLASPAMDPSLSVNETIRRFPAAIGALNALGVDTCCGGAASLEMAAVDAGLPVETLLAAVARAVRDAHGTAGPGAA